jgi:hypothetical protein
MRKEQPRDGDVSGEDEAKTDPAPLVPQLNLSQPVYVTRSVTNIARVRPAVYLHSSNLKAPDSLGISFSNLPSKHRSKNENQNECAADKKLQNPEADEEPSKASMKSPHAWMLHERWKDLVGEFSENILWAERIHAPSS